MSAPSSSPATPLSPANAALANAPHPKGLYVLFFTEMWERFSYYGMRALLIPYMVSPAFGLQPSQASGYYKWYTSLVYLAPLFGGLLADRYIGTRSAILIGAVLMALGHFLMAFPDHVLFITALGLLIFGNGFFKPNISTTVGRMYTKDDPRRDRAFTIFYMGINLGAGISSLLCPYLREKYNFHWGFGAAGVAMLIGLLVFTFGQHQVKRDVEAVGNTMGRQVDRSEDKDGSVANADTDLDATRPRSGGFAQFFADIYPIFMIIASVFCAAWFGYKVLTHETEFKNVIMPIAFGGVFVTMAVLLMKLKGRQKDKSITIFIMFLFPVLFWMAFEQAGNALNLWAEDHTDRSLSMFGSSFTLFGKPEYPGGWWQSANSVFIVALAPVFAALWGWLARTGREPSTPMKMFWAMVLMAASFGAMIFGAASESHGRAAVAYQPKAGSSIAKADFAHLAAGRLSLDASAGMVAMKGVLPDYTVRDVLSKTTPDAYTTWMNELVKGAAKASKGVPYKSSLKPEFFAFSADEETLKDLKLKQATTGTGNETQLASLAGEGFTLEKASDGTVAVTATDSLPPGLTAELYVAGSEPEWKKALKDLAQASHKSRVSGVWLMLSYLLATLGELCLSPVGLSMVTKLAPARFASLFMGVWLLSSSVAQYVGGSIGESWGEITPTFYFWIFVGTSVFGSVLVLLLVKPLKRLMHDVA